MSGNLKVWPRSRGFTLIELMIVLAIVATLAAAAYPSYMDSIRKARRSDAGDALLYIQQLQEKYRANHTSFGTSLGAGVGGIGYSSTKSSSGYYTMTLTGTSATGYTITATAVTGKSQVKDAGCKVLTIVASNTNPRGSKGPTACWSS